MNLQKLKVRELPILRESAKHAPHCFSCGRHNTGGNLVLAHSNSLRHGRGFGFKTPDYLAAIVCADAGGCHDEIDGRSGNLTKEGKREKHERAHEETFIWWMEMGYLVPAKPTWDVPF